MAADLIHPGHIKIIQIGDKLGEVIVGLLTDEAVTTKKKRSTIMSYTNRLIVVQHIKGVEQVIPQFSADYRPNLIKLKPAYVVHGDDWSDAARQQVVDTLAQWGGQLVELPYMLGISSTMLRQKTRSLAD